MGGTPLHVRPASRLSQAQHRAPGRCPAASPAWMPAHQLAPTPAQQPAQTPARQPAPMQVFQCGAAPRAMASTASRSDPMSSLHSSGSRRISDDA